MTKFIIGIDRIAHLYSIGIPVPLIASVTGHKASQVKGIIRRRGLQREPLRYADGVAWLTIPGEQFRPASVPGYWVSNIGRVLAMGAKPGTELKPQPDKDGYLRVHLYRGDGTAGHYPVHRLVATAFHGPAPEGRCAAHSNGNRTDNRASNLRWATQAENVADKAGHGTAQVGEKHGRSRITSHTAAAIKGDLRSGASLGDVATRHNVSRHIVADISRGRTWRNVP